MHSNDLAQNCLFVCFLFIFSTMSRERFGGIHLNNSSVNKGAAENFTKIRESFSDNFCAANQLLDYFQLTRGVQRPLREDSMLGYETEIRFYKLIAICGIQMISVSEYRAFTYPQHRHAV